MVSAGAPSYVSRSGTACCTFEPLLAQEMMRNLVRGGLWLMSRHPVDAATAAAAEAKTRGNKGAGLLAAKEGSRSDACSDPTGSARTINIPHTLNAYLKHKCSALHPTYLPLPMRVSCLTPPRSRITELGFDTSELVDVPQAGCLYAS